MLDYRVPGMLRCIPPLLLPKLCKFNVRLSSSLALVIGILDIVGGAASAGISILCARSLLSGIGTVIVRRGTVAIGSEVELVLACREGSA